MQLYTIMPLDIDHIDEICEDIKNQYNDGIATCALFSMTLTPEGNPVADKATILCEKYMKFKEKLSSMGLECGILVQATIGHGWVLGEHSPFVKYVCLSNGNTRQVCCPFDANFKEYIRDAFVKIAKCGPHHIMVDDDLRLIMGSGDSCTCHLHMERFNKYAGTNLTREELHDIIYNEGNKQKEYSEILIRTQKEAVVELAEVMREAIDSVDEKIPGSYCCISRHAEFAYEIASTVAGKGNPIVVRVNQGHYCCPTNHWFVNTFMRAAQNVAKLKDKVDCLLAETDTCPQNRYSTSAMSLHTQFAGTIIEGISGAKHWITRLASHEPQSGVAYRRILKKYAGFYNALSDMTPKLNWRGFRIPVRDKAIYNLAKNEYMATNVWSHEVFERLGLPIYFSPEAGGITALAGALGEEYDDAMIKKVLSGSVIMASSTASDLVKKGYGEYLGVDVREWTGKTPISEKLNVNGNYTKAQNDCMELVPLSEDVIIDSRTYNTIDHKNYEYLFPGVTVFENSFGGKVAVFASKTIVPNYSLTGAFSFLNYSRKLQLARLMQTLGEDICYYPDDEEVYMRVADMDDGRIFCGIFNLGFDSIENVKVAVADDIKRVQQLSPDGSLVDVKFTQKDGIIETDVSTMCLEPVILILEK